MIEQMRLIFLISIFHNSLQRAEFICSIERRHIYESLRGRSVRQRNPHHCPQKTPTTFTLPIPLPHAAAPLCNCNCYYSEGFEAEMAGGGSSSSSFSAPPYQLIFIFLIVMLLWGFSSYLAYEDSLEETMDQLKLFLMISPVILLLAVRCFSGGRPMRHIGSLLPASEPDAIHRAGSSPWGVGLLVVLLLVMISYQSFFHDQWFPLLSRD